MKTTYNLQQRVNFFPSLKDTLRSGLMRLLGKLGVHKHAFLLKKSYCDYSEVSDLVKVLVHTFSA